MHLPHVLPFARTPGYFFTACVAGRKPILACAEAHGPLIYIWTKSAALDGWFVGRYVLMPDHVHFFASPAADARTRADWCKAWKSISSRRIIRLLGVPAPIWQPETFDHILRSSESYAEKWHYVVANPVRAGSVSDAVPWPGQGEIHTLKGG